MGGAKGQTSLTKKRIELLSKALRQGNTRRVACKGTGTPQSTFFAWMKTGNEVREALEAGTRTRSGLTKRDRACLELLECIEKAESDAIQFCVANVLSKVGTQWQAAAWWLERRHPKDFAQRRVEEQIEDEDDTASVQTPAELAAEMDQTIGGG